MRLLLVAALAVAALAARESARWNSEVVHESLTRASSFMPGFEYRFHLDSQVANGLAVPGSEQAAVRTQSLVVLSFSDETLAHLRIEKIRVASLQKELAEPKKIQPFNLFEEIEINEDNFRSLLLPFRFRYENGLVSEIEFDREDVEWSKNIKRVYLNMLQVNLSQKNSTEGSHRLNSGEDAVFTAPEVTLEGDCEVTYSVLPESSEQDDDESELRVTKSINFDKCTRRVGQKAYASLEKDEQRKESREIESSTLFDYKIVGTASGFLIREVELRSTYVYAPLAKEDTLFTTYVSGKLSLVEIAKEEQRPSGTKSYKKESLLHSLEWEHNLHKFIGTGDESILKELMAPYTNLKNKPELIARLVKSLVSHMESDEKGIELAATHEMGKIVRILRISTKEEIRRMDKDLSDSKNPLTRDVFTDALALAGSFNTIEHLIEKIRAKEVSPLRASHLLKQLSSLHAPSEKIVRSLITLCKARAIFKESDSKRQPLERQSCWLTVGAVMHGVCGGRSHLDSDRVCPRDLKKDFVAELVEQFDQATTLYEKTLALKALANSGMDMIVFPLEKIIRDEKEERAVRVEAIEALRKLHSVLPRKLVTILLPLFKNRSAHPEMRVAAFHQIMQTDPEKTVVDQIANHLEFEPSTQVYSFVYSAFTHLAESSLPEDQSVADSCKAALKALRMKPTRVLSSTNKQYTAYHKDSQSGATLNLAALFSADGVLPKELSGTHGAKIAGKMHKHLAHVGFKQHGVEKKLYKLLEKVERAGLEDIIVRGKRSVGLKPAEALRELFSSLSISPREETNENAHALFYIRVNDMDYALFPFGEDIVSEILSGVSHNGKLDLSSVEAVLAKGLRFRTVISSIVYDYSTTVIHSMGMPLTYTSQLPMIFKVEGEVSAEFKAQSAVLRVNARPTLAITHVTKVETLSPLCNLGVKILHNAQVNLPVDMTTELSWKDKFAVKTTLVLPKESASLAHFSTRPMSFVRTWPKSTTAYVQAKEKTIYVEQLEDLVHKVEETYFEKATGIKLNVDGHYHGHIFEEGVDGLPSALLIGENNFDIRFEKTEKTPKEYVFNSEIDLFAEETGMEGPKMDNFIDEDNEQHFMAEYEDDDADEEERRASFRDYVKTYKSGKVYSHRLFASVKSVGGRKECKAEVELKTVCDEKMRHCRVKVNGFRTPLLDKETRDWTVETEIEMLYPEMPVDLAHLREMKHRELSVIVVSRWGSDEKNQMTVKIQGEQNLEQKNWMKLMAEKSDDFTPMEEYYRLIEASMLNQYKAFVKYDIRSPATMGLMDRLYSVYKTHAPFFSSWVEMGRNQKNVVRAQLTLTPLNGKYANLTISTPSDKFFLEDIYMASPLPRLNIHRQSVSPIRSLSDLRSAIVEGTRAECTVESHKVNSFDNVIYRAPLTTCYSVLAKDCSSDKPEFAVLLKKVSKTGEEKKLKIISREDIIEMELDKRSDKMRVTINGEIVEREERLENVGIYKNVEVFVVDHSAISVHFDGYTAIVRLSEKYRNKQCGICGHFDGEKKNEFRRADNEETEDLEEFHRSFLVKDDECEIEEKKLSEKRNYRIESTDEESVFETKWEKKTKKSGDEDDFEIEPIQKTRVYEGHKNDCFSMQPVPECPKNTVPEEKDKMRVGFACFDRSTARAARFLRESRHHILDLSDFNESFAQTLNVPRTCVAY